MKYIHLEKKKKEAKTCCINNNYERQKVMRHDSLNQSVKEKPQKQSHIINFVPLE